jgi:hypothetical protein
MTSNDEFKDAVEAGSSGNAWDPKEQAVIIGTYKAKKSNVGPNASNMYMVREDDKDEDTGVWGSSVIDSRFEEVPVGSRVRIEFLGTEKSNRGNTFKNYSVKYIPNKDAANVAAVMGEGTEVE